MKSNSATKPLYENSKESKGLMKKFFSFLGFKGVFILVALLLIIIFALQNNETTSVQFLFWKIIEVSKFYLIALSTVAGLFLGLVVGFQTSRIN